MAIADTVTLPAQPTSGRVHIVPLGGDGFTAPHSMYTISDMALTGDVAGGSLQMDIIFDERYCSLVQFVTFRNAQATPADAEFKVSIFSVDDNFTPVQLVQGDLTAVAATIDSSSLALTWNPTPILFGGGPAIGRIRLRLKNVDADVVRLSATIFLFNIRVRETTPMGPLLWARGAT